MRKITRKDAIVLYNFFSSVKQLSDLPKGDDNKISLSPDVLFCTAILLDDLKIKVEEIQKIARERVSPKFTEYQEKRTNLIMENMLKNEEGFPVNEEGALLAPGSAILPKEKLMLLEEFDEQHSEIVEENLKISKEFDEFLLKEVEIAEESFSRKDLKESKNLDVPVDVAKVLINTGIFTK